MKTITRAVTLFAFMAVGVGAAAAESKGIEQREQNRSACGSAHAADANVNGNFGWLGEMGGTPGYHNGARGQQPGATGYNNSHTNCQN